jgi:hypothetical protein
MTFVIATGEQLENGLRVSRFEDASDVPEPGVEVVVSGGDGVEDSWIS